ncbi:class I SAM-dependent methyltransferase [Limosilactobacillus reuteri subsp. suis]|uniref:class I SAM-dependent methyltransferase n=1 Tax=Limosilactobacillus reuteri TaxID=1598 RepID=UPI003992C5E3
MARKIGEMKMSLSVLNTQYWTERAASYGQQHLSELRNPNTENWKSYFRDNLFNPRSETTVLDIGTGPGFLAILLAELGYRVTAIDINRTMLKHAKHNAQMLGVKINTQVMDATELNYEDCSVDLIVSRNLTWNLEKPELALYEWYRVLRPNGILMNFDANWYHYLYSNVGKKAYNFDRRQAKIAHVNDYYQGTDISTMEKIAKQLPLSKLDRPKWDKQVFTSFGATKVEIDTNINPKLLSYSQQINFRSTPNFCIKVRK